MVMNVIRMAMTVSPVPRSIPAAATAVMHFLARMVRGARAVMRFQAPVERVAMVEMGEVPGVAVTAAMVPVRALVALAGSAAIGVAMAAPEAMAARKATEEKAGMADLIRTASVVRVVKAEKVTTKGIRAALVALAAAATKEQERMTGWADQADEGVRV